MSRVALCRTNVMRLGPAAMQRLLQACASVGGKPELKQCLDRCATCATAAIAIVDGSFVGAATAEELAEGIEALGAP